MSDQLSATVKSELRAALLEVFPPEPIAAEVLANPGEGWQAHESSQAFEAGVVGQAWDGLSAEFLAAHPDALIFLGDAAFIAVVPAYLLYLVENEAYNEVPFAVGVVLTRKPDPLQQATFDSRISRLTDRQRGVVKRIIQALIPCAPMEDVMAEAFGSYWRDR